MGHIVCVDERQNAVKAIARFDVRGVIERLEKASPELYRSALIVLTQVQHYQIDVGGAQDRLGSARAGGRKPAQRRALPCHHTRRLALEGHGRAKRFQQGLQRRWGGRDIEKLGMLSRQVFTGM